MLRTVFKSVAPTSGVSVDQLKEIKTTCYDKKPKPDFIQKHTLFQWDAYIHICKYLLFIYTQEREK